MKLEICANGIQSALNAEFGGAHRIELCVSLENGGLTPSYGLIKEVKKRLSIPIHVLIRPRPGNFIYNDNEKAVILEDIIQCGNLNVAGIVIGALTKENNPDFEFLVKCKDISANLVMTFNRAFDIMNLTEENIEFFIQNGFKRILTSGGKNTALEGIKTIKEIENKYGSRIEIMAGAGINPSNILKIIQQAEVKSVHTSARLNSIQHSNKLFSEEINTDSTIVKKLKEIINAYNNL